MNLEWSLRDAQEDLFQRTLADEFLADVFTVKADDGVIAADVQKSLSVVGKRTTKLGAGIIVLPPIVDPEEAEVLGGIMSSEFSLRVLEDPITNRGSKGTQLPALVICRRLIMLHHFARSVGVMGMLRLKKTGGVIAVNDEHAPVAYEVRFSVSEDYFNGAIKVETPVISPNGGAQVYPQLVTLTCGTEDADIFYTTDGSYPRAGRAEAKLYSAPFSLSEAATVRACAFKSGLIASDVNAAVFQ